MLCQAVLDSYLCLVHLTTGIVVEALFNAFATAAFFKFLIFSVFEMRYLLLIWKARRPHGFNDGCASMPHNTVHTCGNFAPPDGGGLTLQSQPRWESMRRELSMLYSRFYACLLGGILVIYQMQKYPDVLIFAAYSFWVPQVPFPPPLICLIRFVVRALSRGKAVMLSRL